MKTQYLITTSLLAASLLASQSASAAVRFGSDMFGASKASVFGAKETVVRATPSRTITVPDGKGGMTAYLPKPKSNVIASSTFEGKTTEVSRGVTGAHVVKVTDSTGASRSDVRQTLPTGISVPDGKGGWTPYVKPARSNVIASSTFDGKTTEVTRDVTGAHVIKDTDNFTGVSSVVRDPKIPGISVPDGKGGWKPYPKKPRSKIVASSTFEGTTTVVTLNDNGTHTVTVTDPDGHTTSTVH